MTTNRKPNNGFNDEASWWINRAIIVAATPLVCLVYYLYVKPVIVAAFGL